MIRFSDDVPNAERPIRVQYLGAVRLGYIVEPLRMTDGWVFQPDDAPYTFALLPHDSWEYVDGDNE